MRAGSSCAARHSSWRSIRFTYFDGIDSTLVLLPSAGGRQRRDCGLPRRTNDVRGELGQPLDQTFTAPLTPGVGEIAADEQAVIDRTTKSRLYEYSYLQAQDGSPVMVLAPSLAA